MMEINKVSLEEGKQCTVKTGRYERTAQYNGVRWYGGKYTLDMEFTDTMQFNPFSIHQWEIEKEVFNLSTLTN